jgi:hypothetical protein
MKARWPMYIAAAPVMIAASTVFVLLPAVKERDDTLREINECQVQLTDFSLTTSQLPGILLAQQALDSSVHEFDSRLYAKEDILRLFGRLNDDAASHGLELTEISPSVAELLALKRDLSSIGDPQYLNLTLRITGDYLSFGMYIESLEAAPYFRGVNFCRISVAPDRSTPTSYTVGFKALLGRLQEAS